MHVLEDVLVDDGTQVVNVRDKEVLLALREELVDETRVHDRVKEISVTRGIPRRLVLEGRAGRGEERLLVDTGVARLVERHELDAVVRVLLDDAGRVLVRVERVHEDERNVDVVSRVEVLKKENMDQFSTTLQQLEKSRLTSICLTLRSKKVIPSRTSMIDLGPTQPIVVPRPPLSLRTASLSRREGSEH